MYTQNCEPFHMAGTQKQAAHHGKAALRANEKCLGRVHPPPRHFVYYLCFLYVFAAAYPRVSIIFSTLTFTFSCRLR